MRQLIVSLFVLLAMVARSQGANVIDTDICIYGGTSGGVIAAIQAAHMGKSVSFTVFDKNLGGMTTGGLSSTDKGNMKSIGGLAKEFYDRVGKYYGKAETFNFEPHVARSVFEAWLSEAGIKPRFNQRLASVVQDQKRIKEITMEDGTVYRAKMFIDASYEGDLMAKAGVSFTVGREGTNVYGESLNGVRARTPNHQFSAKVDPYVTPGKPESGLLPFVQPGNSSAPGEADQRLQAYNYRLCFTQNATNKLPILVPKDYNPERYELLGRLIDAKLAIGHSLSLRSFFNPKTLPNGKLDLNNNGPFSTDFIGVNYKYPTDTYVDRARAKDETLAYTQGLVYYLANSSRSPASLRAEIQSWGPCKDEWPENGGYSTEIYVREARRMVGDYIMTQANCLGARIAKDSVCLGSYNMDTHNCQRLVQDGLVRNEGDVQMGVPRPYPIAYRAIVPRATECKNLLVTFAISASHIGFGSIRMEPVLMMISQSAATAAAIAIDGNTPVQEVQYEKLALKLASDSQILSWGSVKKISKETTDSPLIAH
ncbi:MAG: hypothetical protein JWQ71_3556 [Pedosphaera sp.]|nr:hypothetical protein [Pedosphaera sp.]